MTEQDIVATKRTHDRLTAVARRAGAGDDAPDVAQQAIVWYLSLPKPLTQMQAERPITVLARRAQTYALNTGKRARRLRPLTDIRVTYADRMVARERATASRAVLDTLTDAERALLLAERGTITSTERVRRHRLICKLRAKVK